jgi:glycosyltransferase involved in cell wall biosynthesis
MRYQFTVFTPTYNRAHTLHRVYDSLKIQTFKDFEWVIVDDGSTDATREIVEGWQKEGLFPIRYFTQRNQHKKVAFNKGVQEAQGEFFLNLDSDDACVPEALERFNTHWWNIPETERAHFIGVCCLCKTPDGNIVGDRFPSDIFDSDSLESFHRYRVQGEKWGFLRLDVIKQFPFPENVIGLVPESLIWSRIAKQYKTRFVNDALRIYYCDGFDVRAPVNFHNRADGTALRAREALENEWEWLCDHPTFFLKSAANYTRSHLHLQDAQPGKRWPLKTWRSKLLVALCWPLGALVYIKDRIRHGK